MRVDLSEALDELLHTNRQLALANEKQLSFRIIAEEAQKPKRPLSPRSVTNSAPRSI